MCSLYKVQRPEQYARVKIGLMEKLMMAAVMRRRESSSPPESSCETMTTFASSSTTLSCTSESPTDCIDTLTIHDVVIHKFPDTGEQYLLGQGTFGAVFKCNLKGSDIEAVIKIFAREDSANEMILEAQIQAHLFETGYVPRVLGIILPGDGGCGTPAMVQELCAGGFTLADALESIFMPEQQWARVCRQIALALWSIHQEGVTHNDIKCDNILIDERYEIPNVYYIDFGNASYGNPVRYNIPEEDWEKHFYISPEVLRQGQPTSTASDVYSLGHVFQQIARRQAPRLLPIAEKCMREDPERRPSAAMVLTQIFPLCGGI